LAAWQVRDGRAPSQDSDPAAFLGLVNQFSHGLFWNNPMSNSDERLQKTRNIWTDYNNRQEFEHELINRKTTWWLTSQTVLLTAYSATLGADVAD
jgi:hypothetical protein